jgi:tRNA (guanine-N7-)-methyltransferase
VGEDRYRRPAEVGVFLRRALAAHNGPEPAARRVLYGRRKGRPLRAGQKALLDTLLPRIGIDGDALCAPFDPRPLFGPRVSEVWLEIGFGAGEHLAAQARARPDVGLVGCEPFINGVARLLAEIDAEGLENVRILHDDARLLLAALGPETLGRAFVLFPDPWPKTRHHKRRVVGPDTVNHLARVLADGAELRIATDDPGYKGWILRHVLAHGAFEWTARRPGDWRARPAGWPGTRYEEKAGGAGRVPAFLTFVRRPRILRQNS